MPVLEIVVTAGLTLACCAGVAAVARRRINARALDSRIDALEQRLQAATAEAMLSSERLEEARAQARGAIQAREQVLTQLGQEFRLPMNVILSMTELLLDTETSAMEQQYLGMIKASAESLTSVINDFLDYGRMQANRLALEAVPFLLRDTLGNTLNAMVVMAERKGLTLRLDVHDAVPDALLGDPGRLRQIVLNLVENAIKFTGRGEVSVQVALESETEKQVVLAVRVTDSGIGIAEERQKTIFEPFSRKEARGNLFSGGAGLGLALCARLVEMMGGRIWVESMVGQGSSFHFTVPCERAPVDSCPPQALDIRGMAVLVVAHSDTHQRQLTRMLSEWGLKPQSASHFSAAVEAVDRARLNGEPIPLVLLDSVPAGEDIFALAPELREVAGGAGLQVIMLTSAGLRGDAARCREAGIAAYLTRPLTHSDLLDAIMAVMATAMPPTMLITRHLLRQVRRRLRILLAEDSPVNQTVARTILEDRGHTVLAAANGAEALDMYRRHIFDLILTDVQMPVMDGYELTSSIRALEMESGTHMPIVAVTANSARGDRERCLHSGMDGYVTKPIYPKDLFEAIDAVLGTDRESAVRPSMREPVLIDRIRALETVQGSPRALRDKLKVLTARLETDLPLLHAAVRARDGDRAAELAEAVRAMLDDVAARPAAQAAVRLAAAARNGVLDSLAEHHTRLVSAVELLSLPVQALLREGSMRLLVAEDNPLTRTILEDTLQEWGYDVVMVEDGQEAWRILQMEDAPRLALLDWEMPGMDGVQVCREVRRLRREPYIYQILLTGRDAKEDIVEGLDAGADDYLVKPFDAHELKVRLRAGLRVVELQEELIQARERLRVQATHDPLTGAFNRAALLEMAETELGRAGRANTHIGIVLMDLDHFKRVNDTHGHVGGDTVLREVVARLKRAVRTYDNVGRYGGEEFVVLLPGCDAAAAAIQAERLRRAVADAPIPFADILIPITTSIGLASTSQTEVRVVDRLVSAADQALYRAKGAGRNRVEEARDSDFRGGEDYELVEPD